MIGNGVIPVGMEPPPLHPPPSRERRPAAAESPPKGKAATRGRFKLLNAFVDFSARELRRNELLVWLILYRDTRDGVASTAQADLARRAGISKRTVIRTLRRLADLGLLTVVRRGGLRRGPSAYRVRPLPKVGGAR
jgi:DNA-binding transcriptional ArsR family regulator